MDFFLILLFYGFWLNNTHWLRYFQHCPRSKSDCKYLVREQLDLLNYEKAFTTVHVLNEPTPNKTCSTQTFAFHFVSRARASCLIATSDKTYVVSARVSPHSLLPLLSLSYLTYVAFMQIPILLHASWFLKKKYWQFHLSHKHIRDRSRVPTADNSMTAGLPINWYLMVGNRRIVINFNAKCVIFLRQ